MALVATASSNATTTFLGLCDRLLGLGDKYYLQNKEWKRRKTRLENYEHELRLWKDAASDRGLSSHDDLTRCLKEASARLEEEIKKLELKEGSRIAQVRRHMSRTLFPSQVEISLQRVDDAFDDIRKTFEKKEYVGEVLDKVGNRSVYSDSLSPDSRYVHFNDTESKIFEALNDDNGYPVVLLDGGAGRGKSTVAGNTAAQYDPERNSTFACVVLHDCSSEGQIHFTELLHQLIQRLGHKPVADPEEKEASRSIPLERQFKNLLKERKVLLILDDLRDDDFLQKMVAIGARGLKILITAQEDTVCRNLDPNSHYVRITIQDIDKGTARKILAAHAGFSGHEIPHKLHNYADQLIAKTDHQPLALAILGAMNHKDLRGTEEEWANLCRDLSGRLKSDRLPKGLFFHKYPKGLWSTLKLIIRTKLSEGARKLVLLAHAFSDPVIPEAAIWFLFNRVQQGDAGTFSVLRKELCDRQVVTIKEDHFSWMPKRAWHVHSLQKLYIESEVEMRRARDSVLDALIGAEASADQPGDDILLRLVTLYAVENLTRKAARKTGFPVCTCDHRRAPFRKMIWFEMERCPVIDLEIEVTREATQFSIEGDNEYVNEPSCIVVGEARYFTGVQQDAVRPHDPQHDDAVRQPPSEMRHPFEEVLEFLQRQYSALELHLLGFKGRRLPMGEFARRFASLDSQRVTINTILSRYWSIFAFFVLFESSLFFWLRSQYMRTIEAECKHLILAVYRHLSIFFLSSVLVSLLFFWFGSLNRQVTRKIEVVTRLLLVVSRELSSFSLLVLLVSSISCSLGYCVPSPVDVIVLVLELECECFYM